MPRLPTAMAVAFLLGTADAMQISQELDELKQLPSDHSAKAVRVGDAQDVVGSSTIHELPERAQMIFRLAAQMTEDDWYKIGSEGEQALKSKFNASRAIRAKVQERCAGKEGDCTWRQKDLLLCQMLQLAGVNGSFGSLHTLENIIMAMLDSSGDIGVDWKARAAMIARWKDSIQASTALKASPFADMKNRVLATPSLESLVTKACLDLARFRPECRSIASEAIFCEALAQGSTVAVAADKPHWVVLWKLEALLKDPGVSEELGLLPILLREAERAEAGGAERG